MAEAFLKTTGGDPEALLPLLDSFVDTSEAELRSIADADPGPAGRRGSRQRLGGGARGAAPGRGNIVEVPGNHMSAVTKPELGRAIADFLDR